MIAMPGLKLNWFSDVMATFLIFLFMYTAINKFIDLKSFETTLSLSPYLKKTSSFLAWFIPISEVLICILLFIPRYRKVGLLFATILMGIFALYIGFIISFSKSLPCTCGGVIEKMSWSQHLIFNIGVFSLSLLAWKLKQTSTKNIIAIIRESRTPV
jgi:putative oxidoreductase